MEYCYAELDGSDHVKALLRTETEMSSPTLIPIASLDESLLGRLHVGGGVFEEPE